MPIGVNEDHVELQQTIRRFADEQLANRARAFLDLEAEPDDLTLGDLRAMELVGLHVDESLGGGGASFLELCVVLEELGRIIAPGGFLTSSIAVAILATAGDAGRALVPSILDGSITVTADLAAITEPAVCGARGETGAVVVSGSIPALLNSTTASHVLTMVALDEGNRLCLVDLRADGVAIAEQPSIDPTRRVSTVELTGATVTSDAVFEDSSRDLVHAIVRTAVSAEITGGARACLEAATEHAKTRIQFGRPIGQFQAIKHLLANLLLAVEQMTAATWDAALAIDHVSDQSSLTEAILCAEATSALTLDGGVRAAKDAIQILGGMGFTWEHDAHLFLRRALTLRSLLGTSSPARQEVARRALAGERRQLGIDLPAEADVLRSELEPVVAAIAAADPAERTALLGEHGLQFPHWPIPFGRGAGAIEQLVIDELLREHGVRRPPAHVTAWALPTLIAHGTPEQQERFVTPSLRGEIIWCQLFSEPGAGSDLASLSTKATKVEGGWQIDGQKVWTSAAKWARYGILLARSDPDASKHHGITYFVLDMAAEGVDIRPLREITGESLFNEVFLDGVFIPDDCVIGSVNDGWRLARTTLANERVALAGTSAFGDALEQALVLAHDTTPDAATLDALGRLLVDAQSLAQMRQRSVLRSVFGLEPGPEASLAKLLGAEHDQRVSDFGLSLLGPVGATAAEGAAATFARQVLHTLCLTIAGGTSEVQRNVIGERLLGLPRDPEPTS